ncbi:LysR substrate-binding domain-containing protein [Castellaniella sp.]|uniref:LysR substrate-binding domain-containing protein n=1 Tax=Castellaniella sp. TaxID=1955812 RepID=UPI003C741480
MSIGGLDLNLLKVFEAVYEDRNLLRAGQRLNLSQSAVSHALSRLRDGVGDTLFLRTGKGLVPTARAIELAPILKKALDGIKEALETTSFSPAASGRRFVIAANDHVTLVVVAPLLSTLRRAAPGVDLVVRPSTRLDLAEQIDLGRIDLAIGAFAQIPSRFGASTLMVQDEAVLMRQDHPAARRRLTLRDFAAYPLVTVSVGGVEEGAVDGFILERGLARQSEVFDRRALQEALARVGLEPRLHVAVPHALAIPALLLGGDMMSIVPSTLARALAGQGGLLARPLPYRSGATTTRMIWHQRNDRDPAHAWLRGLVADACPDVG